MNIVILDRYAQYNCVCCIYCTHYRLSLLVCIIVCVCLGGCGCVGDCGCWCVRVYVGVFERVYVWLYYADTDY